VVIIAGRYYLHSIEYTTIAKNIHWHGYASSLTRSMLLHGVQSGSRQRFQRFCMDSDKAEVFQDLLMIYP
jgi:hypothetical protein